MKGEETRAKQLSAAEKPTGTEKFSVADQAGGDKRISEVEKILGSKTQKPFLICRLKEREKGVQLQKIHIIYFTLDAHGTEQKAKLLAK